MEDRTVDLTIKITEAQRKTLDSLPPLALSVDFYGALTGYHVEGSDVFEYTIFLSGAVTALVLDQSTGGWLPFTPEFTD